MLLWEAGLILKKKKKMFLRPFQPFPYSLTTQGLHVLEGTDKAL